MKGELRWHALLCAAALGGCASSAPESFYTLEPVATASATSSPVKAGRALLRVAINSVRVPDLVDRDEMVFQGEQGKVTISEDHRWAEPLRVGIGRVLAEDLASRLGSPQVTAYPERSFEDPDYIVNIDVRQWQVWPGQKMRVSALWTAAHANSPAEGKPHSRSFDLEVPLGGASLGDALAAQNAALGQLADVIAKSLLELPGS
jgi:uncharacterized lipoprotein YmbA